MVDHHDFGFKKPSLAQDIPTHLQDGHDNDTSKESSIDEKTLPELENEGAINTSGRFSHAGSQSRGTSISSADTDPLEPLELALSGIPATRMRTAATAQTSTSTWSRPPDFEVTFDSENLDPSNPREWPFWYRMWTIFNVSYGTWVIVLYSTSYTATTTGLEEEFNEPSKTIITLGVTTYLMGLATGSLVCAPLSELFGRRPLYLICLTISALLIIPCAMATSLPEIIIVRFFGAVFGSVMITNGAGTITDISTEDNRALYMSLWSIAPLNGPVTGPLIGGFVFEYLGWRWDNWLVLILTGAAAVLMATVKETYTPQILKQKAAKRRKEEGDERYWCVYEDSGRSVWELVRSNLSRPFTLTFGEPILWFFNIWISVIYGILYLVCRFGLDHVAQILTPDTVLRGIPDRVRAVPRLGSRCDGTVVRWDRDRDNDWHLHGTGLAKNHQLAPQRPGDRSGGSRSQCGDYVSGRSAYTHWTAGVFLDLSPDVHTLCHPHCVWHTVRSRRKSSYAALSSELILTLPP